MRPKCSPNLHLTHSGRLSRDSDDGRPHGAAHQRRSQGLLCETDRNRHPVRSRHRAKDYLGEIRALFEWVKANIRYTRDIHRVELLHSPRRMLQLQAGDCDDMTILLSSMLKAVGHPVRLTLAGFNPRRRSLFTHVYLEVLCKGRWIPLDPTVDKPMGWAPPADHIRVFSVD